MTDGWITYKVPKQLYTNYKNDKIDYWDMILSKGVKHW